MAAPLPVSVVIPALNASSLIEEAIASVGKAAAEVVVANGGSSDGTSELASAAGATVVAATRGRGPQLAAGAARATQPWLLFLHADTQLADGWAEEAGAFIAAPESQKEAAVFRLVLDDRHPSARRIERLAAWRARAFGLPYGDQGLLVSRSLYDEIGGFKLMPLMEDVDIVRRIGKRRLHFFESPAVTSAERYRRNGWWARPARNLCCLCLYFLGVPPRAIARLYG